MALPEPQPPHLTNKQLAPRVRLGRLLFRHTRPEDMELTDWEFLKAVQRRCLKAWDRPLIDPNE